MDPANTIYVLALLVGAVIVVVLLLRIMKARHRAHASTPPAATAPCAPEEEEYLDSSHILPGGTDAARVAQSLRQGKGKPKPR
ncbi:MAG: hypothetical protein IT518_09345 [Burkholderiales bacterium]|nr:hypothetical protein [Burkholderiales bacterium]